MPQAFANVKSIIIDGEILLIDINTGKPLPFGTLAIHKKEEHSGCVGIILFDILYLNGESLMHKPIEERRKLLEENVTVIPKKVELSDMTEISVDDTESAGAELTALMNKVCYLVYFVS